MKLEIQLGPVLFTFLTHASWIGHAASWFRNCGVRASQTVCIDAAGRICTIGEQFMRADREKTYPITVYHIDPERQP